MSPSLSHTDPEKDREKKKLSARRRRALAPKHALEAELKANRDRNKAKRDAARPVAVAVEDMLKDAARVGPADPKDDSGPDKVWTGTRVITDDGDMEAVDLASADDYGLGLPSSEDGPGGPVSRTRVTLEVGQLGKGYDYNPENTFGEPWWWNGRLADSQHYSPAELRWVSYCLGGRRRDTTISEGKAMERRGLEIAATLFSAPPDARLVAEWLRDGWTRVPSRSVKGFTPRRVQAAMRWLLNAGLLEKIGESYLIR